ncbi:MAG: signal peptidase I [Clostridia bacterium]|nr:signal peptidase I [Clostridia bacterium]
MAQNKKAATKESPAKALIEYVELFVFAVVFVILLMTFCFRLCEVDGDSMNQTLTNKQKLVISNLFYKPETGDIVVLHMTESDVDFYNKPLVKRVIATAGQYVRIDYVAGQVFVSDDESFTADELLDESAYIYLDKGYWNERAYGEESEVFAVPEGHIFVMGDNRNGSADSRSPHIGPVPESAILGRAVMRLAPLTFFGR